MSIASQDDRTLKNGPSIGSAAEGDGFEASIMAAITALTQEVWEKFRPSIYYEQHSMPLTLL